VDDGNGVTTELLEDGIESHPITVPENLRRTYDPPVNRYRITYTLLGLALAAVAIGAVVFAPSGRPSEVPDVLESYSPIGGSTVLRQIDLEIDLPVGYEIVLVVDGVAIPNSEIKSVPQTGKFTWRPGPTTIIPDWSVGLHTVWLRWDRGSGLPDPGEWIWTFRVQ
jgi:hypothetical protein